MEATRPILTALLSLALAAPALTQTSASSVDSAAQQQPARLTLDDDQIEARLAEFKLEIGAKVVPARERKKGKRRIERWLDRFQVVQSDHYLVYTNGPRTSSKRFAITLEEFYDYLQAMWPFEDLGHKLTAYVFANRSEYYDFCVEVVGWTREHSERTAGHATGAYYATYYQSPKSETVIHEATHQIVAACLGITGVGSWFQEGMAEFASISYLGRDPASGMRGRLKSGHYYDLHNFLGIRTLLSDPLGHGSRNYAQASAFVDFMVNTKDERMRGKFLDFLKAAKRSWHRDAENAARLFQNAYGMTVDEVQQAFIAHHGLRKATPKQRSPQGTPAPRTSLRGAERDIPRLR